MSVVRYVTIHNKKHRIVKEKKGRRLGYRLQNYGRIRPGKHGWMNVIGGWKPTLSKINEYIKNRQRARH